MFLYWYEGWKQRLSSIFDGRCINFLQVDPGDAVAIKKDLFYLSLYSFAVILVGVLLIKAQVIVVYSKVGVHFF